ncbi:MAG: transporter substrate-binding domain-containing protein [Betaproteobacteria bacterium]|nr:transporter substrate-binding domain-containing protein [Betaproteobacteria bacterium]
MWNKRRRMLACLGTLLLSASLPVWADNLEEVQQKKQLRIAVYNNFPPYSFQGKGIDVDLGQALAERLGVRPEVVWFSADDDMNDDLRNMVWKGHYLGTKPADVMMHVPVDQHLAAQNDKVQIFGPYHMEAVAVARNPARVQALSGSAAIALEVFTREKVGVERTTLADSFLLGALNGRLRENVVHYGSVAEATAGLKNGEVAAVMAPRTELEAALGKDSGYALGPVKMPELKVDSWALGMAVKADSPELANALNKALTDLEKDGTVAKIFARYGVTRQAPGS